MWYDGLFEELESMKNAERSVPMAAYMRNQFPFLGIAAGPRKLVGKPYFKRAIKEKIIDFDFVKLCFEKQEREYHLTAVDYLLAVQHLLSPKDIPEVEKYILTKSWWDTVDGLDGVLGTLTLHYPEVKAVMLDWSKADNFWLRRVAIDHQLLFKEKTDKELLRKIIKNNLGEKEFFINKAIGWSLRDYSKTNPEWVSDFISANREQMAPLSIREGSKYI